MKVTTLNRTMCVLMATTIVFTHCGLVPLEHASATELPLATELSLATETSTDTILSHLLAQYDFEDASALGTDGSEKGNHGVPGGKLSQSTDAIRGNGSAYFDSTNHLNGESYMAIPAAMSNGDELTVMAWLKFDRAQQPLFTPIFYFSNGVNADFELLCNSGRAWNGYEGFYRAPGQDYAFFPKLAPRKNSEAAPEAGNAAAQVNRWHHVAVTMGQGTMKIFVNGQLAAQQPITGTPGDVGAVAAYLGGDTYGGSSYHGLMDDVRIYDKALTPQEIATANAFTPNDFLQAHYTMDDPENFGFDSSRYGHHAQVVNGGGALTAYTEDDLKAARFDGKAFLQMPNAFVIGNQGLTVDLKIKLEETPAVFTHLIDFCNAGLSDDIVLRFTPGISAVGIHAGNPYDYFDTSILPPLNEWVNVSMTFDADAIRLYMNGALIFEETEVGYDASDMWNTPFNRIGKSYDWESSFVGLIDDVKVFAATLSQEQIVSLLDSDTSTPYLSALSIDGTPLKEFSPLRTAYYYILDADVSEAPAIQATALNSNASVNINPPAALPGDAEITVLASDGKQMQYVIHYLRPHVNYDELKSTRLEDVTIRDEFWTPILQRYASVTAPYVFQKWYEVTTGELANYKKIIAGERNTGGYVGTNNFWAADYYTVIAGAERLLRQFPNEDLQAEIDGYVDLICAASESMEDGYLGLYNILNTDGCRFDDPVAGVTSDLSGQNNTFDLDQMGALCEAGVEYYKTTGKTNLLRAAVRFADCAASYALDEGHSLISVYNFAQLGLTALYEFLLENPEVKSDPLLADLSIDENNYLNLSQHLIESHGNHKTRVNKIGYGAYAMDDTKYYQKLSPTGAHAGSANCFMTSLIEQYRLTGEKTLALAAYTLARNVIDKQMYVTGGTGSTPVNEAYGGDYHLPNATAYCETCTAGYMMRFVNSMSMAFADGEFGDIVELEMYNTLLGAVGLDGRTFFYLNAPSANGAARWTWHDVPCCTKMNLMTYGNLASYLYYSSDSDVYVSQYVGSDAVINLGGQELHLAQTARWAQDGYAEISLTSGAEHLNTLYLRLPEWSANTTIKHNGVEVDYTIFDGFAVIEGPFSDGDTITIQADNSVQLIEPNGNVAENVGKVAIRRGPVIYCVEGLDNFHNLKDSGASVLIPTDPVYETDTIQIESTDVIILKIRGLVDNGTEHVPYTVTAIPFYARASRGLTSMNVWLNEHSAHTYSPAHNETSHYDLCACGDMINVKAHSFGEWTVGEESKTRTCSECGYTEEESLPKDPSKLKWIIPVSVVAGIIVIAMVVTVIIKIRKK